MDKIGVLIVDSQLIAVQLFETIIRDSGRYELICSVSDPEQAYYRCSHDKVGLILMDVFAELGAAGLDIAARIKQDFPEIPIIILASDPEVSFIHRARESGANSFWYKDIQAEPLLSVMDRTVGGESVFPSRTPEVKLGKVSSYHLTERELEVLRELVMGRTNEQIGKNLGISVETVRNHVANMFNKTGFSTRTELAVRARETGLVIPEPGNR